MNNQIKCQKCLHNKCKTVDDFDINICFSIFKEKYKDKLFQDIVRSFLKVVCLWPESEKKILQALFLKNDNHNKSIYWNSDYYYCHKKGHDNSHVPGQWWTADCSLKGNDLFSLVKSINRCSDYEAFLFAADILEVDLLESKVVQFQKSKGITFIPNCISYPSYLFRLKIIFIFSDEPIEYIFHNDKGSPSFKLLEWRSESQRVYIFLTIYEDNKSRIRTWEYMFPSKYSYMIYNIHYITNHKRKTVNIHDDISEAKFSNSLYSIGTWAGDISIYSKLDWSFLKGRNVSYLFDKENILSIQIGSKLIQTFNDHGITLKLFPRVWPTVYIHNGNNKTRACEYPSWPEEMTLKKFYKYAEYRHNLDLKPKAKINKSFPTTIRDLDNIEIDTSFMVNPLFKEGAYVLITARQKVGKSLLAMDISYMLSTGESIGSRLIPKKQYNVLYVDSEMPINEFKNRIIALKELYVKKEYIDDNFNFINGQSLDFRLDLTKKKTIEFIEQQIKNTKFIVFDNLDKLAFGASINANKWDIVSSWFKSLTKRGITVFLIHHENNDGKPRGTGKITDDVDLSIALKKSLDCPKGKTIIEFHIMDSRYLFGDQCDSFIIEYCTEENKTKRFIRHFDADLNNNDKTFGSSEINSNPRSADIVSEILNPAIHDEKGYVKIGTFIVNGKHKSGKSRSTIKNIIKDLCKSGQLIKTGVKQDAKYWLKENHDKYHESPQQPLSN